MYIINNYASYTHALSPKPVLSALPPLSSPFSNTTTTRCPTTTTATAIITVIIISSSSSISTPCISSTSSAAFHFNPISNTFSILNRCF